MAKENRGGKYIHKEYGNVRYWTPADWGRRPGFQANDAGHKLGFEGSGIKSYLYYDEKTKTYYTIRAHSAKEAQQIAKSFGYVKKPR